MQHGDVVSKSESDGEIQALPNTELMGRMPSLVCRERGASAEVIVHLVEIDRRRLYLEDACSSLYTYCVKRLAYSEDEALRRVRVTRLAKEVPSVVEELRSGTIHLTGLFLLSRHLTPENAPMLLAEARGKSRSELELLIAARFPRPDVAERVEPIEWRPLANSESGSGSGQQVPELALTCPDTGVQRSAQSRSEPLSPSRYRIEFTASAEFHDKLKQARELLSHAVPSGDFATLFERALDALLRQALQRRMGTGRERIRERSVSAAERGEPAANANENENENENENANAASEAKAFPAAAEDVNGTPPRPSHGATSSTSQTKKPIRPSSKLRSRSRYVPRAVARAVWERDSAQCVFVDAEGRRCGERRFLTLEHREPHALGGAATVENLCLYCKNHNIAQGRLVFGKAHAQPGQKASPRTGREAADILVRSLRGLGFHERDARRAVQELDSELPARPPHVLLRKAILRLTRPVT